jgi:transcriptional regulator with XRE-family HTH domain
MPQTFAERLKRAWLELQAADGEEVDQAEIAKRVGMALGRPAVAQATVSRWFRGTVPDVVTVAALAKVMRVSAGWLAFGDPGDTISAAPAELSPGVKARVLADDRHRQKPKPKRGSGGRPGPG